MAGDLDKSDIKWIVAIVLGIGAIIAGIFLYLHHRRAKGMDFAESLAAATATARYREADAELSSANVFYVDANGDVELPQTMFKEDSTETHQEGTEFRFVSPRRATASAQGQLGAPASRGDAVGAGCAIVVTDGGPGVRQRVRVRDTCDPSLPTPLRCSLAQVWATAIARGAPRGALADISLNTEGTRRVWDFKIIDWNAFAAAAHPVFQAKIDDDCRP